MGLLPAGERNKVCYALVFTACSSRHLFVWLTFSQTTEEAINGFEAAWEHYGGIFPTVLPDNLAPVVADAGPVAPHFNDTFIEYAQERGFAIDPARVRHPKDKPKVDELCQSRRDPHGRFRSRQRLLRARPSRLRGRRNHPPPSRPGTRLIRALHRHALCSRVHLQLQRAARREPAARRPHAPRHPVMACPTQS
jgi:transposase